jgi:tartrate-resistant acid phosphatase type 5
MHSRSSRQLFFCICMLSSIPVFAGLNNPFHQRDSVPGLKKPDSAIHFIVMGDWGRNGEPAQQRVADVMGKVAAQLNISFVISTGDNFYPGGVAGENDPQWRSSFERVYTAPALQVPWFPVLGNHDYALNPDAQPAYSKHSNRWYMPARYYDTGFVAGIDSVLFVFIDTYPMERELRGLPHDAIKFPGVSRQLQWLELVLSSSNAKWKMVIGHNPLYSGGSRRHSPRLKELRKLLQPVFIRYKVDVYMCGHEHHLEYLKPGGPTHFFISGAASSTYHVGWLKKYRKFAARKEGFVTFSLNRAGLMVQFVSDREQVLYQTMIVK